MTTYTNSSHIKPNKRNNHGTHCSSRIQCKIRRRQCPKHRALNFGNLETMTSNRSDLWRHRHSHFWATFLRYPFSDSVVRALDVHCVSKTSFLDCYPSQNKRTKQIKVTHARTRTHTIRFDSVRFINPITTRRGGQTKLTNLKIKIKKSKRKSQNARRLH